MSVEPRPASTVVLVRDRRDGEGPPEIFFVKRHHRSGFMANAYVFPGGRVEPSDFDEAHLRCVHGDTDSFVSSMAGIDQGAAAAAHALAALRETFEEAGILVARHGSDPFSMEDEEKERRIQSHRDALNRGDTSFASILEKEGLHLSLNDVHYFAHWITPVIEKRRYNARFFLAVAPHGQLGSHDDIETTDSCWLSASDALAAYERGGFSLAPPTWYILRDLAKFERLEDVLEWVRGLASVDAIMPHFIRSEGMTVLTLPGDSEHPESSGGEKTHRIVLRDGRWWDS